MSGWVAAGLVVFLLAACDPGDDVPSSPFVTASDRTGPAPAPGPVAGTTPPARTFATLPQVDRFSHPEGPDDVVVQVAVRAPFGPDVPLLTVYGDGDVVAGTSDGWRTGTISDLRIQGLLDDAEAVGLIDEPLVLRRPRRSDDGDVGPDVTIRFDVDGRVLVHELDLARIERPPNIRVFVNSYTVDNRLGLTEVFEPSAWVACDTDACEIVPEPLDASSRPVLPHEDAAGLVDR